MTETLTGHLVMGSTNTEDVYNVLQEKDIIIQRQAQQILLLQADILRLQSERDDLLESLANFSLMKNDQFDEMKSVTSAKSSDDLIRRKPSSTKEQTTTETPSGRSLTKSTSHGSARLQRQRSFKRSEEDYVKRSRSHNSGYELSQDLHDKQVEMLERKYGGSIKSRHAAKTIQQAFRQYCMNKNFEKLRNNAAERRKSKRLSDVGRSHTIWGDRITGDGCYNMGATFGQAIDLVTPIDHSQDVRKRIAEFESVKHSEHKQLHHQVSLDPSMKLDLQKVKLSKKDKKKLERSMHIDIADAPKDLTKGSKQKSGNNAPDETNNNRNSYPEMNDSSASDSPQATPVESTVDLHSLDFENLLESKETDILTDSFHSDGSQEANSSIAMHQKQHGQSKLLNARLDSVYDNCGHQYCDGGDVTSAVNSDIQIKVEQPSPEEKCKLPSISNGTGSPKPALPRPRGGSDTEIKYYTTSDVKLQNLAQGEDNLPPVPGRTPDASPIWKRKSVLGVNGSASIKAEQNRMSNISETSEPDSIDGQCSSSPSSENISSENISIGSENSVGYQRKIRVSMTPDTSIPPRYGDKQRKRLYRVGLNLFNKKTEKGLQYLIDYGFLDNSPRTVAKFLIVRKGLSKKMIGEYLGNIQNAMNMEVLEYFANDIDLSGMQVDVALRKFQSHFRMPGEAQKIERLMEAFAQRYCVCNPDQVKLFRSHDAVFLLAYAVIMLNTDLHNSNIKPDRKIKLEDFIKNLRGIDDKEDVDRDLLIGIYERVKAQEFRPGVDHVTQVMKVESTIIGKKPPLSLCHRRLVCYCRLYEVHDPNKKEKIGLHQREVFLFNDLLMITKIFSKKKSAVTYAFKQSFPLYGMQVFLFETSHYQFGVRLTTSMDKKALITFNARNDHDRQKFVEDIREAILETNNMETMRIEDELQKHRSTHNTIDKRYHTDDFRVPLYDHMQPSDPGVNRLSAPECGLKKTNSCDNFCAGDSLRRDSSAGSLDSGVATGSVESATSREESLTTSTNSSKGQASPVKLAVVGKRKQSPISLRFNVSDGTEV